MSIKKSDIRLVQFSNYVRPKIQENQSKDWVLNGKNNSFYQDIIDRYNGSTTNSAVINSYVDRIYGQGLRLVSGDATDWIKFKMMLSESDVHRVVTDYVLFGEASMQIIQANGKDKLPKIYHLPKQDTAPQKVDEDNEINGYYFSLDWSKPYQNTPEYLPILGSESGDTECYVIRPYRPGRKYFSDPDYLSGLQYCMMEEEISNYYVNHIKNGLSFGYIVNIPDGANWSPEEKDIFEDNIKEKLVGSSNAGKFVISFNGVEQEVTVVPIDINDAHKQWEFLTQESTQKILTAHRVTSPMLFGVKDSTGLGNNAQELIEASKILQYTVIKPKQKHLTKAFEEIANFYNLNIKLEFTSLYEEPKEEVVDVKMSEVADELDLILNKYAQDPPEGYELHRIEYDVKGLDVEMAATANSWQDDGKWKVRYAYNIGTSKTPKGQSRDFCNRMMRLADNGKVFRVEDIEKMGKDGVNKQFGHEKKPYDIFLYGGGVNCYHRWERRIYKKKTQDNGNLYGGNALQNTTEVSVSQARKQGAKIVKNPADVAIAEINKPNKGKYPS